MKVIREYQKDPKDDTVTIVEETSISKNSRLILNVEQAAECERQLRRALQGEEGK
jgi:hypothetical protein